MAKPRRGVDQGIDELGGQGEGQSFVAEVGLFDRMGEDSYVNLKRRNGKTQQFEFVAKLAPEEVTEEFIQDRFGGGNYFLQERLRTEQGKYVYGRQRSVTILGEPKAVVLGPSTPSSPAPAGSGSAVVDRAAPTGNIQNLMEMGILQIFESMQNASKMQMLMLTKALEAGNRAPQNDRMMELLLQIVLDGRKGDSSSSETMRLAKEIAELAAPKGGSERRGVGDVLEEVRALKDAAGILGMGEDGGDDSWAGVAKQFAPVIARALDGKTIVRREPKALPSGGSNVIELIRPAVPKLIEIAKAGRDPYAYAQVGLDNMPGMAQSMLKEFLSKGKTAALTKWWEAFPETTAHREWFIAYASVLAELLGVSWAEGGSPAPPVEVPAGQPPLRLHREDPGL